MVTNSVQAAKTEINTSFDIQEYIAGVFPFNYLPPDVLENLLDKVQLFRYRMGQLIVTRKAMPEQMTIIYQGQARLLGYEEGTTNPVTLKLLSSGEVLGWVSHVRGIACETAIASSELIAIHLPIADFLALIKQEAAFAQVLHQTASLIEVYELLKEELNRRADGSKNLVKLAQKAAQEAIAQTLPARNISLIMSLPNGYNTRVGERGSALSGGQRQRVAIARTVLQNPQLLILDEATSALDYNAEAQVCRNLATACQGKTVFFITHRLSTIRNADVILMMDQGAVVEQGTHEQLMALKGYYYSLYQQQETQI